MTALAEPPLGGPDKARKSILKIAILAVGGQGGGVLTNWIERLARAQGYDVQATSVAGVAQRTGATIYYIEMAPAGDGLPVFALAPAGGDVDIVIAAEMMEAGRAILRGFVTPDRTTLITSTHRALAVSEKSVPGDGIASSAEVRAAAGIAASQLIMFDMDRLATENGSVISSTLFGALAGSGALPFATHAYEEAIRATGKGVEASLRAFRAACEHARAPGPTHPAPAPKASAADDLPAPVGPARLVQEYRQLEAELERVAGTDVARRGLRKVVDFQDIAYGRAYIAHLEPFATQDTGDGRLTREAAKNIANAMCYDDIIRVADRKTRVARLRRIHAEMSATDMHDEIVHLTEFFHPRGEEIISLLPARLGTWIEDRPGLAKWIDRRLNKGRRLRSDRLRGFLVLYAIAGLRRTRRQSLRHRREMAQLEAWLTQCRGAITRNHDCAVEMLMCQRLIKGYSDTHARGLSKFARVMQTAALLVDRPDGASWIARLREAALADENGEALEGAIKTVRSFLQ